MDHTSRIERRAVRAARQPGLAVAVATIVINACTTSGAETSPSPEPETVTRVTRPDFEVQPFEVSGRQTSVLGAPLSAAWQVLAEVYDDLGIPVTESDPVAHQLGNPGYRSRRIEGRRLSRYLECGFRIGIPNADTFDVTLMVVTRLTPVADSTRVVTTVDATAKPRGEAGSRVQCGSRGSLELRIVELLAERFEGRKPEADRTRP